MEPVLSLSPVWLTARRRARRGSPARPDGAVEGDGGGLLRHPPAPQGLDGSLGPGLPLLRRVQRGFDAAATVSVESGGSPSSRSCLRRRRPGESSREPTVPMAWAKAPAAR